MPADQAPRMERSAPAERGSYAERSPQVELPPRDEEIADAEGLVEVSGKGFGFLRDAKRGFTQNPSDVFVTPELCRAYNLRDGQWIKGQTSGAAIAARNFTALIESQRRRRPKSARNEQPAFDELTVVSPLEKLQARDRARPPHHAHHGPHVPRSAKAQRGLIVAPPRTGKTTLLQHIADAVVKNHPEIQAHHPPRR